MSYLVVLMAIILAMFFVRKSWGRFFGSMLIVVYTAVIIGFRAESVGVDTPAYYRIFHQANAGPYLGRIELLYIWINQAVGFFTNNPAYLTFVVALFTLFPIAWVIQKYSKNITLSWLVFINYGSVFAMTNTIRELLAVSIAALSVPLILKGKHLRAAAPLVAAFGIHYSAIITPLFYFFRKLQINILIIVAAWLGSLPFILMPHLAYELFSFFSFLIPEQYVNYLQDPRVFTLSEGPNTGLGIIFKQCLYIMLLLAYIYIYKPHNTLYNTDYAKVFVLLGLFSITMGNYFNSLSILSRIFNYFDIFLAVSIPIAVEILFDRKSRILVSLGLCFIFCVIYLKVIWLDSPPDIFPFIVSLPF